MYFLKGDTLDDLRFQSLFTMKTDLVCWYIDTANTNLEGAMLRN